MSNLPQSRPLWAPPLADISGDILFDRCLIDPDIVTPGADNGYVGTGNGGNTVIGATGEFELKLIGEGRTMDLVLILHGHLMTGFLVS
jgi:hypothetical protein